MTSMDNVTTSQWKSTAKFSLPKSLMPLGEVHHVALAKSIEIFIAETQSTTMWTRLVAFA